MRWYGIDIVVLKDNHHYSAFSLITCVMFHVSLHYVKIFFKPKIEKKKK